MREDIMNIGMAVKSSKARKALRSILEGIDNVEIVSGKNGEAVDVVFVDASVSAGEVLSRVERWMGSHLVNEVVLLGENPDPDALIMAMRMGVKEFLPLPVSGEEVLSCLSRISERAGGERSENEPSGTVITVAGGKSGVGSTTLAVNLAHELNKADPGSTVLLDMGRPYGEVPLFLDLDHIYTWGDVAENLERLDSTFMASVLSTHDSGLRVLPAPAPGQMGMEPDSETVALIISALAEMFPRVVVDERLDRDDISGHVLQRSDVILAPLVLSLPCLVRVKRFLELTRGLNSSLEERMRLVVNRQIKNGDIEVKEAEEILGHPVSWTVPDDYRSTMAAMNQGKVLTEAFPRSPASRVIRSMARDLCPGVKAKAGSGWFSGLFKKQPQPKLGRPGLQMG